MKTSRSVGAFLILLLGAAAMVGCSERASPSTSPNAPASPHSTATATAADITTLGFESGIGLPADTTVHWDLALDDMQGWELVDDRMADLNEGDHVVYNAELTCVASFMHLDLAGTTGLTDLQASDDALRSEVERGAVRMDPAAVISSSLGFQTAGNPGLAARRYIAQAETGVVGVFFARALVSIERGVLFFATCDSEELALETAETLLQKNTVVLR
ncbi:hypothetical protein ACFWHT_10615 [Microbacterium sp. NPDC058342]|uniref:hypothetical protein n=1 Tax=Microbacterium sp. NPDC058342 TaxID=3346454 RepID=UPI0036497A0B